MPSYIPDPLCSLHSASSLISQLHLSPLFQHSTLLILLLSNSLFLPRFLSWKLPALPEDVSVLRGCPLPSPHSALCWATAFTSVTVIAICWRLTHELWSIVIDLWSSLFLRASNPHIQLHAPLALQTQVENLMSNTKIHTLSSYSFPSSWYPYPRWRQNTKSSHPSQNTDQHSQHLTYNQSSSPIDSFIF